MRVSHPKPLETIFTKVNLLNNIQHHAMILCQLNNAVRSLLPTALQSYCHVANYRKNILIIETSDATKLMGLRYEQANILKTLRADILPGLIAIDLKINPQLNTLTTTTATATNISPKAKLSATAAQHLLALANDCPISLQEKLKRLADLANNYHAKSN